MSKSYSVTTAGVNPDEDRAHRMRMYFIAMTLRVLCIVSLFWLRGWWVLLAAFGAAFLPWFAVMVGNAVAHGGESEPETPAPLQLEGTHSPSDAQESPADTLIVVDAEPTRRGTSAQSPLPDTVLPSSAAHADVSPLEHQPEEDV